MIPCEGCGRLVHSWLNPCMDCIKARHRGAVTHRCSCGKLRRETEVKRVGSRTWISCHRCLATVRQLS